LHHRLVLLWASTKLPGLLDEGQRQSLITEVLRAQNPDGGLSLSALLLKSGKGKARLTDADSDGYATGLVTLVLQQTAMPQARPRCGAASYRSHVNSSVAVGPGSGGRRDSGWRARSTSPQSLADAVTAYAVLALTEPFHVADDVKTGARRRVSRQSVYFSVSNGP
jgi:hypothetical protein